MELAVTHDNYVDAAPSFQAAVDLIPGWTSKLPEALGVVAGPLNLFEDGRIDWAEQQLGTFAAKRILELGPLEAAHTYQLLQKGAESILAIEANRLCFLKCLIVKELLDMKGARFLLGNFMPWMETDAKKWDVVWASGVLYHMPDPLRFLELVSARTDKLFIWTHYADEVAMPPGDPRRYAKVKVEQVKWNDRTLRLHRSGYYNANENAAFMGGASSNPAWMEKEDILYVLKSLGFKSVIVGMDAPDHLNGPAFCIAARR